VQIIEQKLEDITGALTTLEAPWQDAHAAQVIALLRSLPIREEYTSEDVARLFEADFREGLTAAHLFLGMSKDELQDKLSALLAPLKVGSKTLQSNRREFLAAFDELGLPEAVTAAVAFRPTWSDILIERLRTGRGKAIKGQKRGRGLEDFTEGLVREVFGENFESRCQFNGVGGIQGKCDFAIPNRVRPLILIEAKGYGATGRR
jgi:hypothetical protein